MSSNTEVIVGAVLITLLLTAFLFAAGLGGFLYALSVLSDQQTAGGLDALDEALYGDLP